VALVLVHVALLLLARLLAIAACHELGISVSRAAGRQLKIEGRKTPLSYRRSSSLVKKLFSVLLSLS
jgi:hypothetical protein